MKLLRQNRFIITMLYGVGLVEIYYLPRYGIALFVGAISITIFGALLLMHKNRI